MRRTSPLKYSILCLAWLLPGPAAAHAFAQRYDLPIPLGLYIAGAGLAVALSFVVTALVVRRHDAGYPRLELTRLGPGRLLVHPVVVGLMRALGVAVFVLIVAAGLIGTQNQFKNIAPTLVWVIWWVGLAYVSALVGDLWRLVNPFATVFRWAEALHHRLTGVELSGARPWPKPLGVWPAVALFFLFAWSEVVWSGGEKPFNLSLMILAYALIARTGMLTFGREAWLAKGEAFTVVFGLLARFAPTEARTGADGRPEFALRPPAVGLLAEEPISPSLMAFVLLVLATVTFDGFRETPAWVAMFDAVFEAKPLLPLLTWLYDAGVNLPALVTTLAMLLAPCLFFAVYMGFAWLTRMAAGSGPGVGETARRFVLTLVPIAIAYHLAHYLSLLLIAGQLIIPLSSDPFGFGWDLFGTTLYLLDISLAPARFVWYTAVTAIVAGHIAAVYLAHRVAFQIYPDRRAALRSQIPMLALMVGYTMVSLWILAQPVVAG
ncbi:MAG: hypothetical protein QF654_04090 [Alphaproteobacteria bacterium]|jgi:hypothetical protein|nr:hypothetical protein [Alphaproteobacteria bacterium]